jgi:hypothetical protein
MMMMMMLAFHVALGVIIMPQSKSKQSKLEAEHHTMATVTGTN